MLRTVTSLGVFGTRRALGWGARCAALLLGLGLLVGDAPSARADVAREIRCLAMNIYHEARGEPKLGMLAVGHVVMNRVRDSKFPTRVCDVIRQGGERPLNRCQFSWWCDGRSDKPADRRAWEHSKALAHLVYWGLTDDPTEGALWYHANYVRPVWRHAFDKGPKLGRHIFYHPKGTAGS